MAKLVKKFVTSVPAPTSSVFAINNFVEETGVAWFSLNSPSPGSPAVVVLLNVYFNVVPPLIACVVFSYLPVVEL